MAGRSRTYKRDGRGRFASTGGGGSSNRAKVNGKMRRKPVAEIKAQIKKGVLTPADAKSSRASYRRGMKSEAAWASKQKQVLTKERRGLSAGDKQVQLKSMQDQRKQIRDARRQARSLSRFTSRRGGSGK